MRGLRAGVLLLGAGLGWSAACSSPPGGEDNCKTIEIARCKAGVSCAFGLTPKNETQCELYARDNCLHGPQNATLPTGSQVDNCVKAIHSLAVCAHHDGVVFPAENCIGHVAPLTATVCDVIQDPEQSQVCAFLIPTPPVFVSTADAGKDAGEDSGKK